ncbi:MAG TPA: ROK family protein [Candidatus Binatia bacterium]|jgi:predicted NBD/HSP70 family sugar kinase|nr:ROK family protein [Candidatus Binatia bacterium]
MNTNHGLPLVAPRVTPVLDPSFRPAVLANRAFREQVHAAKPVAVLLALEQTDGNVSHFHTQIFPETAPQAAGNFTYLERTIKFLLWSRGGFRLHFDGPPSMAAKLAAHYRETPTGKFDSNIVAERMFDHPLAVAHTTNPPAERRSAAALGRHLEGCRIGFDLGGSDRKVAAVIDGKVVYSDETVWDPYFQPDPQYHLDGIMDSLKKAAAHLPRVDAIGGSAAGIYLSNRVKVASLFRGVPPEVFNRRVKDLFLGIKQAWNGVPFEVINDGEVTALAGSMSLAKNRVVGISLGTSTAGGYVNAEGNITNWINELAFVPVDYNPQAPTDEWSADYGCNVQYFSQQAVGRLLAPAGIEADPKLPLPDKLKQVQQLMKEGDYRARKIYETIGTYLGYAVAHFTDFYDLENILILGRVTSGPGGDVIIAGAKEVLKVEFAELAGKIAFHIPDEKDKRHGQAVAAASLPKLNGKR